jgi:siroheme decarboxylase
VLGGVVAASAACGDGGQGERDEERGGAHRSERILPGEMDGADTQLCDLIQNEFPVCERPYAALGETLGLAEGDVLERVKRLRGERIIRQISAIFDTRKLGYKSMLVAAKTAPERADAAAEAISSHPGVTHNYRRDHEFNIWFTVGVPPTSRLGLDRTVELLGELAGVESIRPLPAIRFFKIGVDLDMKGDRDPAAKRERRAPSKPAPPPDRIPQRDIDAIRALQGDLRTAAEPFAGPAQRHGFTVDELLEKAAEFQATGQMRRFAAVLYHRSAGFTYNGMGVWRVPDERVEEMGSLMASYRGVSHCYQRPVYPDWPYNLFSMTHGRSTKECEDVLDAIARETGLDDRIVLYSTKEWKKTRLVYFSPDAEEWERRHAPELQPA